MIHREITGPQSQYERSGDQTLRVVTPLTKQLSRSLRGRVSGFILLGMAFVAYTVPAVLDLILLIGLAYAGWVLTRRIEAPIRLPYSAKQRDWSDPDPSTRKPRTASGEVLIGWDYLTGQEIWLNNEDIRQHVATPGTTGAGKTATMLSNLVNVMCHGGGWCLVDGKANAKLYGQAYKLARRFMADDNVYVINLLTASLDAASRAHGYNIHSQTNTFNPFAAGNADAIKELLVSQLGEAPANDGNGVFRERAVALAGTLSPVAEWMRDTKGVPIDIEKLRGMVELKSIWFLAKRKIFLSRDADTGKTDEILVEDIPESLLYPLQAYLGEIPGYDVDLPYNKQKTDEPSKQHGFAVFYFTGTFTNLAVSLGHIFKTPLSDVVMRDVVMNRRMLIVNLPALEKSDDTLAALGRIIVASLRGMMAQQLGARLEGDPKEIFAYEPGQGVGSFYVKFDETAYYATSSMDRMLAMGRGLNMAFDIAFQELGGLWARLGEKTNSLLGNTNLTLGMRQQDAGRTREWLEKTAGQSWVTQTSSFQGAGQLAYRESGTADVRQVNRVAWQDFLTLLPGEAIVLFGGRRIYATLFYAALVVDGWPRLNRPLKLTAPTPGDVRGQLDRLAVIRRRVSGGLRVVPPGAAGSAGPLNGMVAAMRSAAARGASTQQCIAAALVAATILRLPAPSAPSTPADGVPDALDPSVEAAPDRIEDEGDHPEDKDEEVRDTSGIRALVSEFTPMLDVATEVRVGAAPRPGGPRLSYDSRLLTDLTAVEMAAGSTRQTARDVAHAALDEYAGALAALAWPAPPALRDGELDKRLDRLCLQLGSLAARDGGLPSEMRAA